MTGNSIANRISVPDTFRMLKVNQESVTAIQVDQEKLVLRDSFLKMGKDGELPQIFPTWKFSQSFRARTLREVCRNSSTEMGNFSLGTNSKIWQQKFYWHHFCYNKTRNTNSGSPLMCFKAGRWRVVGIVSKSRKCGSSKYPGNQGNFKLIIHQK